MRVNPITATIDLEAPGLRHGHLKLPHSHDNSAWGAIMIPITVVRGGEGPTALLTGANHGDEYEGPVSLLDLAQNLDPENVSGRVIIVPMMNYPAFLASRRTSPIDNGNLNRLFPGRPDGGPTEKIAHYFQHVLLPMADFVLDIHAGGKTLDFLPMAVAHHLEIPEHHANCVAAMEAFNAPYSMILKELDAGGMYDTAAEEMGKVFVSTELGGGGSATAASAAVARRGIDNFLRHAGILPGEPVVGPSIRLDTSGDDCYITSESSGLLNMCLDLGARVGPGDLVARVFDVQRAGVPPMEYRAEMDGILCGRHYPGLIGIGDCLAVIGATIPEESVEI